MLPIKMLTGGDWRWQLVWGKIYLGMDQVVEADGCKWFIAASLPISQVPFLLNEYRWSNHLSSHFRPGEVMVDAGASIGAYSVRAAKVGMRVYAFEPSATTRSLLLKNAQLNGLAHMIEIDPRALGGRNQTARLTDWGAGSRVNEGEGEVIDVVTLDGLGLPRFSILKIDVEGMELSVLKGARETIRRFRPRLFIEVHSFTGPGNGEAVENFLREAAYDFEWFPREKGQHADQEHLTASPQPG
jgi:FkbM family methyltransferase